MGDSGSIGVGAVPRISAHALCITVAGRRLTGAVETLRLLTTGESPLFKPAPDGTMDNRSDSPQMGDRILAYPLHVAGSWVFRANTGIGTISKKVVASTSVTVPAGTFRCFKIQWLYDGSTHFPDESQILFFDYISDCGLVRRSILIENVTLSTYDNAAGSIRGDAHTEFVLTGQVMSRLQLALR